VFPTEKSKSKRQSLKVSTKSIALETDEWNRFKKKFPIFNSIV